MRKQDYIHRTMERECGFRFGRSYETGFEVNTKKERIISLYHYGTLIVSVNLDSDEILHILTTSVSDRRAIRDFFNSTGFGVHEFGNGYYRRGSYLYILNESKTRYNKYYSLRFKKFGRRFNSNILLECDEPRCIEEGFRQFHLTRKTRHGAFYIIKDDKGNEFLINRSSHEKINGRFVELDKGFLNSEIERIKLINIAKEF